MEDLACVRCIHIVVSGNLLNSLMEKRFIFLTAKETELKRYKPTSVSIKV